MAIRDNEQPQAATQAQGQANQQQQAPQPQQAAPTLQGGAGAINSFFQRSGRTEGGDARSSEALQILNRIKESAIASQDLQNDFQIFRFDRDQNQVGWSSLLIAKYATIGGKAVLAVRPLIMPNASINLPPRKLQIQNGMHQDVLEVEVDVNDVFTGKYWSRIQEFVRGQSGQREALVVNAGALSIPADFDLKDEMQLNRILIKSVNLCDDILARHAGETPFSLAILKGVDETMAARIDTSGRPVHNSLGDPIKSDLVIGLNRIKKNNQQSDNEYYDADNQLNQVSLAINLDYNPQQQQAPIYGQPQQAVPPFSPSIIITDVRQADWIKANTMEMHLFALSNAFRVTASQSWARKFLPQVGKGKDMGDVGALGWTSRLAQKIETKSDTFTDAQFAELMFSMVRTNPTFLMDLDRLGDNAVLDGVYLDAMGGPNQQKATATIIRGVNNLIGGGFEKYFDHTTQAIIQPAPGFIVDKGYYLDDNGDKRDRRDLDTLAALNCAEGNINEWMSWYSTQCNTQIHPELRAKQSRNFDKQYLGNSVTYTGRFYRGVFNPKFIQALDQAILNAGVAVAMDNVSTVFGGQRFTGNSMMQDFAVSGTANVQSAMAAGGGYSMQFNSGVNGGSFY